MFNYFTPIQATLSVVYRFDPFFASSFASDDPKVRVGSMASELGRLVNICLVWIFRLSWGEHLLHKPTFFQPIQLFQLSLIHVNGNCSVMIELFLATIRRINSLSCTPSHSDTPACNQIQLITLPGESLFPTAHDAESFRFCGIRKSIFFSAQSAEFPKVTSGAFCSSCTSKKLITCEKKNEKKIFRVVIKMKT